MGNKLECKLTTNQCVTEPKGFEKEALTANRYYMRTRCWMRKVSEQGHAFEEFRAISITAFCSVMNALTPPQKRRHKASKSTAVKYTEADLLWFKKKTEAQVILNIHRRLPFWITKGQKSYIWRRNCEPLLYCRLLREGDPTKEKVFGPLESLSSIDFCDPYF